MIMKKTIVSFVVLAFFLIAAVGSESASSLNNSSSSSTSNSNSSSAIYTPPSPSNKQICTACNGTGSVYDNGSRVKCGNCNGFGYNVPFPESK